MLEVIKFLLNVTIEFISMLFTIDLGFTNLGTLMCIIYIFLPVMLFIVNFIKIQVLDEFDALLNNITDGLPAEIEARWKQYEHYRDQLLTFKELEQ